MAIQRSIESASKGHAPGSQVRTSGERPKVGKCRTRSWMLCAQPAPTVMAKTRSAGSKLAMVNSIRPRDRLKILPKSLLFSGEHVADSQPFQTGTGRCTKKYRAPRGWLVRGAVLIERHAEGTRSLPHVS